jgi:hypothetical protein
MESKPVAWINASPRGTRDAADIPVAASLIGGDGVTHDGVLRSEIEDVMRKLRDSLGRGTRE